MSKSRQRGLKIVQISAEYPPDTGGVGDYTRLLSRALLARRHDVAVVTGSSRDRRMPVTGDRHEPPVRPTTPDWSWQATALLTRAIADLRPDIVHIQYQTGAYGMHPMINMLPWRIHRLPAAPRIVVTAHDLRVPYLFPKAGPVRRWVTRRLLADADARIITNAADQAVLAGDRQSRHPEFFWSRTPLSSTVIPIGSNVAPEPPEGYDRREWRRHLGIDEHETVVVFFGLASPSKGLLELAEAFAALPPPCRLLVVGGEGQQAQDRAYAEKVRQTLTRLQIAERVIVTGYCDPPTVSAHLLAADIGALPFLDGASYRRGSLHALLAHGVPLVTTTPDVPLKPQLIAGEHALLVAPRDSQALQHALLRLSSEPALWARLSAGARSLAAHFTWPVIAAAHEDVYNSLLVP